MDWSEDAIDEEEQPSLRRRTARPRSPSSAGTLGSGARSPSPPPGGRPLPPPRARAPGSRSPSPQRGRSTLGLRSPSPRRVAIMATRVASSVRTTRRSPPPPPGTSGADAPAGAGGGEDIGVEEILSSLREGLPASRDDADAGGGSGSGGGGGGADEEEWVDEGGASGLTFSFPQLQAPPRVDGAEVLEAFASSEEAKKAEVLDAFASSDEARKEKAAAEFLEATMGANTGSRTTAIKKELLVNGRVLDLAGLERWLRREEADAELAWFTDLCCDEDNPMPPIELFECAFQALENASATELHRGADARRRWIGSVGVPEFFICPISKKVMENPVVISSGKTVDRSALEEWQKEHGRICPVTGEILINTVLIPNILIALCIGHWRRANDIADVTAATDPPAISPALEALFKQATLISHSPLCSKEVRDGLFLLHELVDKESSIVHLFGCYPGTIAKLVSVLPETCLDPDPELDDIIIGIMAKAASYGPNKVVFGDDQYAIPVLIARTLLGPVPARAKCAQILGLLADDHYNKIKIAELGGLAPLVELLLVGDRGVKETVARAIAGLCEALQNRSRFLRERVADAIISALRSDGLVVEAQGILLQAAGFDLAMAQVIARLDTFKGDAMCEKIRMRLWDTFILMKAEGKHDVVPSISASKKAWEGEGTSTSSSEALEGSAEDIALIRQTNEDVKIIVSWLQKKCYYPRTYRYRG